MSDDIARIAREDAMREGLRMFTLAAATLERDVLLHALTEDEQRVLVSAVLNAADRAVASYLKDNSHG